jgi:type II secretory pathway component PulK
MNRNIPIRSHRNASVLVLTLIVVALLTLGAMAFFERMFAERRASRAYGRQLQSRQLAESGVEYIKAVLMQDPAVLEQSGGLYTNPQMFQGQLITDDPMAAFRGRFTVLAPDLTTDGYYGGIRYGLENESARLNLNTVLLADSSGEGAARKVLMTLPGMTESIADAILDWIDTDSETRMLGAEQDFYSSMDPPYAPRNGPIGSIEELLLVREVTPALLFGADLNRNTSIEASEQPLTQIDNVDNSTGALNRGWAAYLTLDSAETNLRPDGTPKIDVNMDDLKTLHTQLLTVFDQEMANFIIAYRQGGRYEQEEGGGSSATLASQPASGITLDFTQQGRERLTTVLDLIGVSTQIATTPGGGGGGQGGGGGGGGGGDDDDDRGGGGRGGGDRDGGGGDGRGGGGGGGQGGGGGPGQNPNSRIVVSPAFPNEPGAMQRYLPLLMDNLAVNASPTIPGRLNINQAPRALLAGVPGLTPTAVDQIIANRDVTLGQQRPEQTHETWLLASQVVELEHMKKLMALVTTGGNVYRTGLKWSDFSTPKAQPIVSRSSSTPLRTRPSSAADGSSKSSAPAIPQKF